MRSCVFLSFVPLALAVRVILSNDDGWAENNVRTFFDVLDKAGYQVVLSAPVDNMSGTGSSEATPRAVFEGCRYSSCPPDSPATGYNSSDPRLNYVNSYPVTSIKTGISKTAPALWGGAAPQLALTGPNVGHNMGSRRARKSGTIGAAVYATKIAKIPAIAFAGKSIISAAWDDPAPVSSKVYAELALNVTSTLVASGTPYLPVDTWLSVNFARVTSSKCNNTNEFKYILTRIGSGYHEAPDVKWCGSTRLPTERRVKDSKSGCYVTISIGDANDKSTVDAARQAQVLPKLRSILSCLP
ncbi:sure-like protein [Lophiostoma macrostomum CBS 122681]|uniref:Sure-like protein n=1 Tax=Lophiostoma macrostomum CBS 122681 TaxID=1314788 RepID=A0A6A6T632_9PLEO|nr:sure-like protein [Lophiostoma macrostomum CBS 122681]